MNTDANLKLKNQIDEVKEELCDKKEEISIYKEFIIPNLEEKNAGLKRKYDELTHESNELVSILISEIKTKQDEIKTKQDEIKTKQDEIDKIKQDHDELVKKLMDDNISQKAKIDKLTHNNIKIGDHYRILNIAFHDQIKLLSGRTAIAKLIDSFIIKYVVEARQFVFGEQSNQKLAAYYHYLVGLLLPLIVNVKSIYRRTGANNHLDVVSPQIKKLFEIFCTNYNKENAYLVDLEIVGDKMLSNDKTLPIEQRLLIANNKLINYRYKTHDIICEFAKGIKDIINI
jgi:hypothetical protein